jgi:hypothetical protein
MKIEHKQAVIEDARRVIPLMRQVDKNQILALGAGVEDTVAAAIHMSVGDAWVTYFDGQIAAVWGIVPCSLVTGAAIPWLLTTAIVERQPKTFFKESRRMMHLMARHYGRLENMIDVNHRASLRWARRVGFEVAAPAPVGPRGALFCKISMERN